MSSLTEYTNAVYSGVAGEDASYYSIVYDRNDSSKEPDRNDSSKEPDRNDSSKEPRNSRATVVLFVLLLALLLAMVAACVAFAVEISKLKSETASLSAVSSFQQPLIENWIKLDLQIALVTWALVDPMI